MDTFTAIVVVGLAAVFGVFLLLGRLAGRQRIADITDKGRNRALAAQAQIEERDVAQMVEASNAYRRRQGLPPVTVEEVRAKVAAEQAARLARGRRRRGAAG